MQPQEGESTMRRLRAHQQALKDYLDSVREPTKQNPIKILCDVVPGGGKSLLPGLIATRFPAHRIAWLVPRLSLARQAAQGLLRDFDISIREAKPTDTQPSRGSRGFVMTHQGFASPLPCRMLQKEFERHPHVLIVDELHHATITQSEQESALYASLRKLAPYASVHLYMTGTLKRNDNSLIYGVPYHKDAKAFSPDLSGFDGHIIAYKRADALRERAIVPMQFEFHDGPVKWQENSGDVVQTKLSETQQEDEAKAIFSALRTEFADQLLRNCVEHWRQHGDLLLVLAKDQPQARKLCNQLNVQGIPTGLATSDEDDALDNIDSFKSGKLKCLVTCQMAYEGLDVPRISHLCVLTHIRSTPWILQAFARAWRSSPGKKRCWAFVPNDPRMQEVVSAIRNEQEPIVRVIEQKDSASSASPNPFIDIVPIASRVSDVHTRMLDRIETLDRVSVDRQIVDPVVTDLWKNLCRGLNVSHDDVPIHDLMQWIVARAGHQKISETTLTERQQEDQIRANISDACRKNDARRHDSSKSEKPDFGYTQKLLKRRTGKSITDMSLSELKHAWTLLNDILYDVA